MNGIQIENILRMIDENMDITRQEAIRYIREHQQQIVQDLLHSGATKVKTSAGDLSLTLEDLTAAAA
jgi:hypothetical protein